MPAGAALDRGEGSPWVGPTVAADGPAWSSKTETDAPPPAPRTYTVVSGDTLWAIAERFYGDGSRYRRIADASGIANPDLIHEGQQTDNSVGRSQSAVPVVSAVVLSSGWLAGAAGRGGSAGRPS